VGRDIRPPQTEKHESTSRRHVDWTLDLGEARQPLPWGVCGIAIRPRCFAIASRDSKHFRSSPINRTHCEHRVAPNQAEQTSRRPVDLFGIGGVADPWRMGLPNPASVGVAAELSRC
jgi:hypothetical protein